MRIIGGKYRGRTLCEFNVENIRPTLDTVRESVFDILQNKIEGSVFLDLFCGSGAMGLEAVSRGASKVYFNDYSKESIKVLEKNAEKIKIEEKIYKSIERAQTFIVSTPETFDIVYLDPPYNETVDTDLLLNIEGKLNPLGVVIVESEKPFTLQTNVLSVVDKRKYGRAYITVLRRSKELECVFAGTFDPITEGHEEIVNTALKTYKKVNIVIGVNDRKTPTFSLEKRIDFIKKVFVNNENVSVSYHEGLMVNFLKQNKLVIFVRGIRNESDLEYEKQMQKFNEKKYAKINTVFIKGIKNAQISSTLVKEKLKKGESIKGLVSENIEREVESEFIKTTR